MTITPFTKQGYSDLIKKLENTSSRRPEAVKQLTRGREMGDLSENGLYKAAKQELNDIDREIRFLKNLVKSGKVFVPQNNDYIQIGHTLKVLAETIEKTFSIVGEFEANPKESKISFKSPIGHNLMGKKIGDKVSIRTPKGFVNYTILSIR